ARTRGTQCLFGDPADSQRRRPKRWRRAMALVRYALTEVLRGRHRTAAAVIGVALAISFLAGTSIAIDSSLRAALDSYLSRLQADFVVSAHTARPMSLADNLTAVRGAPSLAVLRTFLLASTVAAGARSVSRT